jgi:hypothetical protein
MDILFSASWRRHRQAADTNRRHWSSAQPSGVGRLLLALALITAIVALLDHAADAGSPARIASATAQSHQGASK